MVQFNSYKDINRSFSTQFNNTRQSWSPLDLENDTPYLDFSCLSKDTDIKKFQSFTEMEQPKTQLKPDYSNYLGFNEFNTLFDQVEKEMPEAAKYRGILTEIAKRESGFKAGIQNKSGAPAYGYFQFWQDGKINNITHYSGLSVNEFLKNPKAQIESAVKMASKIEKSFNSSDLEKAKAKGYSIEGLISGAWLGGIGGVRKVLNDEGNPSDKHWSKDGKHGTDVKTCIEQYS